MTSTTPRPRRIALGAAVFLLCFAGTAFAQSFTVSTTVGDGTRQLTVADAGGQPLTELALTAGQPQAFRVTVTDTDKNPLDPFTVTSEINNLYQVVDGGYTYANRIPSSQVRVDAGTLGFSAVDVDATVGLALDLVTSVDCAAATADALALGDAVTGPLLPPVLDPVCTAFDAVVDSATSPLQPAVAGLDTTLTTVLEDIDLSSLTAELLPTSLGNTSSGAYSNPSYAGIGAGDTTAPASPPTKTTRALMSGTALTGLPEALEALIAGMPLPASAEITEVDTTAVVAALVASSDAATSTLGTALDAVGDVLPAAMESLVEDLLQTVIGAVSLNGLTDLDGVYTATPTLTVNGNGVAPGGYAGTYTVTLVD